MTTSRNIWPALAAFAFSLTGCSALGVSQSATHLSATQCSDLTALKSNAPPTHSQNLSELAALRTAGYDPSRWFDPNYPDDLQAAQRQVDLWYHAECQQMRPG